MPAIDDFGTWEPLLKLLRANGAVGPAAAGGRTTGRITAGGGFSLRLGPHADVMDQMSAVKPVAKALDEAGRKDIAFEVEIRPSGRAALHLINADGAVDSGVGPYPGALVLVDGAVPEPWRRPPEAVPDAAPAASADPGLLERTLRERLPKAIGATTAEIAAAEERLGIALPDELKALYRVTRAHWDDHKDDYEAMDREVRAVGLELFPPDEVYIADAASRHCSWRFGGLEAAVTPPDAEVQGLVGSPGWIVFGDNGGGDRIAVDLTPGPRGHLGQIIILSHEESVGAALIADSLTDLVVNRRKDFDPEPLGDRSRAVAHVNVRSLPSVRAAAHPDLEVLSIGAWDDEPVGLAPVVGLPRLRTLSAYPGTLADPLEIPRLTGLEFLALGPDEWRVLLDAGAVPRGLLAADIVVHGDPSPLPIVALANEILALWDRPRIGTTVIEGDLGRDVVGSP
ncbi:SMI1/KNR4 family protein [Actinomadura algeriensis]|uniref:Cell wall assembly regulator SMI1 n=1 Tax=Actinomadura algeriensis TaxID=1679523 RepID=A0ABR9JJN8_9ACTN|nr:SMI1/KNR4 family protein [Actinomadura algeriensis]MBE1530749.1 cell wall assembly regulator SMI1 [Actinomadura algeriensis]